VEEVTLARNHAGARKSNKGGDLKEEDSSLGVGVTGLKEMECIRGRTGHGLCHRGKVLSHSAKT